MELKNCFCLSIDDDRYNYLCSVFEKYKLVIPRKYCGFKHIDDRELACLYGHMSIVMMARALDLPYVVIFEDDAYPRIDAKERLDYYFENKPDDCGILVLGRNGQFGPTTELTNFFTIEKRPFGAHAYIVFKCAYDEFIESCEKEKIADIALKGENYKKSKPYWSREYIFIQKNINKHCLSKNLVTKYGRYFYPNPKTKKLGVYDFVPELFEEDNFVLEDS